MNKTDMSAIWFSKVMTLDAMIGITPICDTKKHAELHRKKELCESAMVNCIRANK